MCKITPLTPSVIPGIIYPCYNCSGSNQQLMSWIQEYLDQYMDLVQRRLSLEKEVREKNSTIKSSFPDNFVLFRFCAISFLILISNYIESILSKTLIVFLVWTCADINHWHADGIVWNRVTQGRIQEFVSRLSTCWNPKAPENHGFHWFRGGGGGLSLHSPNWPPLTVSIIQDSCSYVQRTSLVSWSL